MNKTLIYILIAILLVLGGVVIWQQTRNTDSGSMTNGRMLSGARGSIITQADVAYFGEAKGYFARPKKEGKYPGIVLIHENRGLRPEIRTMADELAKEGYMVLAVDLFGTVVETQDEAKALTAAYDQTEGINNMQAAVGYLKNKGATKIASIGWCFGGGQSLKLALSGLPMDATVIYYGQLETDPAKLAVINWPILGIFGDADKVIPVETVQAFDTALDTAGVENEIYIYPGVGHAFANPSGMNYAPTETKDAWAKTVAFLDRHL